MKTPLLPLSAILLLLVGVVVILLFTSTPFSAEPQTFLQRTEAWTEGLNLDFFTKEESPEAFLLTYGWKDFGGSPVYATFPISKKHYEEGEEEFGYVPEEYDQWMAAHLDRLQVEMIRNLRDLAQRLITESGYADHIRIDETDPKSFNMKLSVPPNLYDKVKAEFAKIADKIAKEQDKLFKRNEKEQKNHRREFLESRGLRIMGDKVGVNYSLAVKLSRPRVEPAYESIRLAAGPKSLHEFMALLLAFIQEVRYGIPPLKEKGKIILGFWAPPKVLVNNFGDCDSKGVTFAAVWTNFKRYPLLLVKIPDHLFVGVAVPAPSGEGFVINGRRYTLCEVTGPEKIPPGIITEYSKMYLISGRYYYEMVR